MTTRFDQEEDAMRYAIELARRGIGRVEPNPPVGAVIVDDGLNLLGSGYHQQFGGPHAEVHALQEAGEKATGATMFVTLEPCCHQGKTPPCSRAVIDGGIKRVVIGISDPAKHVAGGGLRELKDAGLQIETGLLAEEASRLVAPFLKRVTTGLPYVHAKWAMTLDGKLASHTGHSQWISSEQSRERVHELRGRMDAIVIGSRTANIDDPLLTARPSGPRTAMRVVIDRDLMLSPESQLVRTIDQAPLLIAASQESAEQNGNSLRNAGAEIFPLDWEKQTGYLDLHQLLAELGSREMTNILVEGGGGILGSLFDRQMIDECHIFIAPKLVGGANAISPIAGMGLDQIPQQSQFVGFSWSESDTDLFGNGMLSNAWWNQLETRD